MQCCTMAAMSETALADPVFVRLKKALEALYGPRLKRVLLYGSRARGDHQPDSDYDVLVVLDGPFYSWTEMRRLSELSHNITWDTAGSGTAVVASFKACTKDQTRQRTGFMHNVRKEPIAL